LKNTNFNFGELKMETIDYKNHTIEIENDEFCESPREWDNLCVFHIAHRRYAFGDKNYNDFESIEEAEKEALDKGNIVLPLFMYDHSGITISLSPSSCSWDSGRVGFVEIPREKAIEELGKKIFSPEVKKRAMEIAAGEVETLDIYLRGDVYYYKVFNDNGEELDSCHGFFDIEEAKNEAKSVIDYYAQKQLLEHLKKVKIWIKNKTPLHIRQRLSSVSFQ
jgi:hypothetical protein